MRCAFSFVCLVLFFGETGVYYVDEGTLSKRKVNGRVTRTDSPKGTEKAGWKGRKAGTRDKIQGEAREKSERLAEELHRC